MQIFLKELTVFGTQNKIIITIIASVLPLGTRLFLEETALCITEGDILAPRNIVCRICSRSSLLFLSVGYYTEKDRNPQVYAKRNI